MCLIRLFILRVQARESGQLCIFARVKVKVYQNYVLTLKFVKLFLYEHLRNISIYKVK